MRHRQQSRTPNSEKVTALQRIGRDPARLLTVSAYWAEFGEPIELLDNAVRTFGEDGERLVAICEANRIPYLRGGDELAFPVWLLWDFYPANP